MNWRISKAAAVLFLSSFLFSSCEDPTAIGLELQEPGSLIGVTYTDTATINASTVLLKDSIVALTAARTLVGRLEDPETGTVTARTFTEISLTSSNVAFDPNNGADSLVLRLDYDYYYGDTLQATTWNVHKLTNGFKDDTTYFTSGRMPYAPEVLGSVTFTPRPRSTYVTLGGTSGTDTLTKGNPVLVNIKLNTEAGKALANEILAQSDKAPLKTQQNFINSLLKGLAIVPAAGSTKNVLGVNLTSINTSLTLYYTSKTDSKGKSYTFVPSDRFFNQIQGDRAGTALASLVNNASSISSEAAGFQTYLQAGTGLVTKLTFPYLANFRKNQAGEKRDLLINKAELIIPVKASTVTSQYPLPSMVTLLEATTNNRISLSNSYPVPVQGEGTGQGAVLVYREKEKAYVVNITTYLQNLLYERRVSNGLILFPSSLSSNLSAPTANAQTINRAIIEANQRSDNTGTNKIRLKVYYSTPQ
ncbi:MULTISPECIES: DUF4270 family protein [Rufibacter]|uniref:DUF4270 domain-containing protein n=1 Tax=Rufibacter quisquiliarum TaxID=1549639 RepID=A0A839GNK8_9BACT|nr:MULTISPECIES: DUF4270 family protein [Rufibacter]MBA9076018.1 hypothetical protein [Rufibacter quisquiliarum]